MSQYLLSVHAVEGEGRPPMTDDEMTAMMQAVHALEDDLKSSGSFVFGGRLHEADTSTVVRVTDGDVLMTDGPFAESKEHIGGFYIIEAADLDAALAWAARVTDTIKAPIEVRPFFEMPGA